MSTGVVIAIVTLILLVLIVSTFYQRGKKALSIFPPINTVNVVYIDRTASGYSNRSRQTQFGGASKTLSIIVTDKELWLTGFPVFAGITAQHDLVHKVPLNRITKTKTKGDQVMVDFKGLKGEAKQVVLRTRDQQAFLSAIQ